MTDDKTDVGGEYEVDNPAIKSTLRDIAGKVGAALVPGWGFLLMLFEYGTRKDAAFGEPDGGSLFYISSADRADALDMMREWMRKQGVTASELTASELNPEHPVTKSVHDQWHKLGALLMMRMAADQGVDPLQASVTFTAEDVLRMSAMPPLAVGVKDDAAGLTLFLTLEADAAQLVRDGKAEVYNDREQP